MLFTPVFCLGTWMGQAFMVLHVVFYASVAVTASTKLCELNWCCADSWTLHGTNFLWFLLKPCICYRTCLNETFRVCYEPRTCTFSVKSFYTVGPCRKTCSRGSIHISWPILECANNIVHTPFNGSDRRLFRDVTFCDFHYSSIFEANHTWRWNDSRDTGITYCLVSWK